MRYRKSLFLFRRDLRADDNTALIRAQRSSDTVLTAFIFDPRQIGRNELLNHNALHFMLVSLIELEQELGRRGGGLSFLTGVPEDLLRELLRGHGIEAVFVNSDYTPFARRRDQAIEEVCRGEGCAFHAHDDVLLHPPGAVLKGDRRPYTMFTPFYRKASSLPVPAPETLQGGVLSGERLQGALERMPFDAFPPKPGKRKKEGRTGM